MKKIILSLILSSALLLAAGCSRKADSGFYREEYAYETTCAGTINAKDSYSYKTEDVAYDGEEWVPGLEVTSGEEDGFVRDSEEKLVYNCTLTMQTLEFEETMKTIRSLIREYDGFIENESVSDSGWNWYFTDYEKTSATLTASLTARIPTEHYDDFLSDCRGAGRISDQSQSVTNITRTYNNTATTIESLKTQEARLLEMMEKAETIEDMLTIEKRLTEVQNQLAIYQSDLSDMDTDVAYSTVDLKIQEVLEYTPSTEPRYTSTFGDRLKNTLKDTWDGFLDFLEGLLFFLIESFPILLVLGLIGGGIAWIVLAATKKKRAAKRALKQQTEETKE